MVNEKQIEFILIRIRSFFEIKQLLPKEVHKAYYRKPNNAYLDVDHPERLHPAAFDILAHPQVYQ